MVLFWGYITEEWNKAVYCESFLHPEVTGWILKCINIWKYCKFVTLMEVNISVPFPQVQNLHCRAGNNWMFIAVFEAVSLIKYDFMVPVFWTCAYCSNLTVCHSSALRYLMVLDKLFIPAIEPPITAHLLAWAHRKLSEVWINIVTLDGIAWLSVCSHCGIAKKIFVNQTLIFFLLFRPIWVHLDPFCQLCKYTWNMNIWTTTKLNIISAFIACQRYTGSVFNMDCSNTCTYCTKHKL